MNILIHARHFSWCLMRGCWVADNCLMPKQHSTSQKAFQLPGGTKPMKEPGCHFLQILGSILVLPHRQPDIDV